MNSREAFYIGGQWRVPLSSEQIEVHEAATGEILATVPSGGAADMNAAVSAAGMAFPSWSTTDVKERSAFLRVLADGLQSREDELADVMAREVGTPIAASRRVQVGLGIGVFRSIADALDELPMEQHIGNSVVLRVAAGVVGAITPWNYPLYQLAAKVAPALAAGCTTVVKPSSVAPLAAYVVADVAHGAGLPPGVLNIVTGRGAEAGEVLAQHPGVDVVSLTGSTSAGARVAELAARSIKRVTLELGGKSAFVLCPDADLEAAIDAAVRTAYINNGQTCSATTRLIVTADRLAEVEERVVALVDALVVGNPLDPATTLGPVASAAQYRSIQRYLDDAADQGTVLVGGQGQVPGQERGWFVRPTVVSRVSNTARIAREEIFGPVLVVVPVADVEEAVQVANDSEYGLSGAVWAGDINQAVAVARRLRTGQVAVNGGRFNVLAPFGGFKRSGIGRELGQHGLAEYFELISLQLPSARCVETTEGTAP
ncbi:aldehyde dehydrogenase family protein [Aeromicrobium sp.]|uniref:aldehyde dehydrogenase family protein n=1 Tax=Aeromicrobium sp. TaxID=1871063 RepID=UPI0019880C9C|nr:aldehyde dehydrogenase family protein [Aeromicrobium sp.]MBC7632687.1 aldehyde dehydrogenase family protein [Aeromicrobium sp.]